MYLSLTWHGACWEDFKITAWSDFCGSLWFSSSSFLHQKWPDFISSEVFNQVEKSLKRKFSTHLQHFFYLSFSSTSTLIKKGERWEWNFRSGGKNDKKRMKKFAWNFEGDLRVDQCVFQHKEHYSETIWWPIQGHIPEAVWHVSISR